MKKRAQRIIGGSPLTFGKGNIKGRIKNVLNIKKPVAWVLFISVLAVILSSVCLLTNPTLKLPDATSEIYNDRLSGATPSLVPLTLDDVRELARKGDNLVFEDFKGPDFSSNFNYYIMDYGVDEFIKGHPSSEALTSDEARAVAESTSLGRKNIEKGTPREVVLKIMGEPNFTLSGLYGDGYMLEGGSTVVFYYGADELVYQIKRSDEPWKSIGNVDVDRDGLKESIYLDQSQRDNGFVTLCIDDSSGNDIWSEQANTSHAGWTSLFLCEQGGEYYLLRYLPGMWQGSCAYTYTLFTLEGGVEHVVRSNTIGFDVNGVNKLDAPDMIAFAEEVNALLAKSTLLLSSEGGEYSFGPSSADRFFERYSWLDDAPELYYADGDDLKTRLVKYSEYAVSNHR